MELADAVGGELEGLVDIGGKTLGGDFDFGGGDGDLIESCAVDAGCPIDEG